jgi:hypothetical protein
VRAVMAKRRFLTYENLFKVANFLKPIDLTKYTSKQVVDMIAEKLKLDVSKETIWKICDNNGMKRPKADKRGGDRGLIGHRKYEQLRSLTEALADELIKLSESFSMPMSENFVRVYKEFKDRDNKPVGDE